MVTDPPPPPQLWQVVTISRRRQVPPGGIGGKGAEASAGPFPHSFLGKRLMQWRHPNVSVAKASPGERIVKKIKCRGFAQKQPCLGSCSVESVTLA